ncbi:MAG: TonB-dependent receptor [Acidobacteriota bacterium]
MEANPKRRTGKVCLYITVLFCLTAVLVGNAAAQELRGTIRGVITDPTGAVVVGAAVTLSNDNTGVEVNRKTNEAGQYIFDFVSAGTYTLRVESAGFRTFVQRNILVQTRGDVTVNAALVLGTVADQVTVEASPVAISFNRTTMETTIDTKMTNSLPLINRNPFLLAQLNPAVNYTGGAENSPYHHWAASQLDVGGNTSTKNDILVDGSSNMVANKNIYTPPMDAVSEVSVQQNAVDAEFGHSAGGIVSVQMKSGTNEFHGTAYYFGRHPKLNAVSDSTTHTPNTIKNHTWGATSQNPFVKNKVFNFFAYEGTNMRDARTQKYTLPTKLERAGDFSQTWVTAGQMRTIYDPLTSAFDPATNRAPRQPFPGNKVPQGRMDKTALRSLQDIWEPNNSATITGANNYVITGPMQFKYWNITDRVDYNISDSVKVFGRLSLFKTIQTENNFVGSPALRKAGSERNSGQAQADMVWTINPTTVFNIRGSGQKFTDSFYDADMIIKGYDEFWPGNQWYKEYMAELPAIYYPGLQIRGATTSTFGQHGFWFQEPMSWNVQSKVSKQMGSHYLKLGGEFRQMKNNSARPRPMVFYFERADTANDGLNPDTARYGAAWATFLLGMPAGSSRIQTVAMNSTRHEFYSLFFQDDLKLTQRVTLNLGLRYEFETALKDPKRRLSRFLDLKQPIPEFQGAGAPVLPPQVMAIRGSAPQWNGAWVFTDDENPGSWDAPHIMLPRAGLAYRINDRTALRIGYARYAVPPSIEGDGDVGILGSTPYPGFEATSNTLGPLQGIPRAYLSDPYPSGGPNANPLVPAVGKSLGRYTGLGDSLFWFQQDFKAGMNERINISLQRQIWKRFVVDLTWFMNFGYNQANYLEGDEYMPNQMDPRFAFTHKAAVDVSVTNPFRGILPKEKMPGPLRTVSTLRVQDLLSPYPQYRTMEQSPAGDISSRYQALQLQVQRPFANGFNLLFGYNYNRAREQMYFDPQDRFDGMLSWFDGYKPRHRATLASIYEFPFGRGRKWGSDWNSVTDAMLGGWSITALFTRRAGWLLRFGGTDLVTGDPRIKNPTRERMWDTSLFQLQPAYTRRANPHQWSGLTGPRYQNLDFTMQKLFKITEKVSFEFRMEAYNMTNSFMGANPSTSRTSATFGRVVDQFTTHRGREFQYSGRFYW